MVIMYNVNMCECFWRLLVAFPLTVIYYLFDIHSMFCTNKDLYYYYYYYYYSLQEIHDILIAIYFE